MASAKSVLRVSEFTQLYRSLPEIVTVISSASPVSEGQ